MLNINELETRWLHYKIKSNIPYAIILLLVIIGLISILLIDFTKNTQPEQAKLPKQKTLAKKPTKTIIQDDVYIKPTKEQPQQEKKVIAPKPIIKHENIKSDTKMKIKPSLDFLQTMKSNTPIYYEESVYENKKKIQRKKTIINKTNNIQKKVIEVAAPKVEIVKASKVKVAKANSITIKRQNTQNDIQHVIKRFKKSNNPALSLFIAKKYYELKNYNKAYNYALITNQINDDIEESWIIFVKSLVKLNKKDKAIKILKEYIEFSHSNRAKILLNNIKSGKMK
jgi:hypothetical protein